MLEQAQQYLARALPWPQDGEPPAYVNIHWTFQPDDHKPGKPYPWGGRACRSLNDAVNAVDWALKGANTRDIYVCLSTQRAAKEKTGKNGFKYFTPIRAQTNAVALKSLFIDIDFKGGEHGYDTQQEAVAELARFLKETGLPKPSVAVLSGGGLHTYWTFARPLSVSEWQPLAYALAEATKRHGLRCDSQCSVDSARVLRIPNTYNRKLDTPRPVQLALDTGEDYSVERIAQALEPYKVTLSVVRQNTLLDTNLFPPRPPLQDNPFGDCGSQERTFKLDDLAQECAFVAGAVATGGKDYAQPEWNLTTLIATFCEDARAQAHRMGNQHPSYTKESTDEMFDRKEREKAQKGLGWPSCVSISAAGCKACQACPHWATGKTPFHALLSRPPAAPVGGAALVTPQVTAVASDLPSGYSRDPDGRILRVVGQEDGTSTMELICEYSMEDPWLQKEPRVLHFTTRIEKGHKVDIDLPFDTIGVMGMRAYLQAQGFMLPAGPKGVENVTRFILSWIKLLHETRDSVNSSPFGWSVEGGKRAGFVFGGRLWTPTGDKPAAPGDAIIARQYKLTGDKQPWLDAAKMITDQKRPALDAILASSFAAPLVGCTGQLGVLISAWSDSGTGKTTAQRVAQAVWADPFMAPRQLEDTSVSVAKILGQISSLPLYWDELKTDEQHRRFISLVFQVTGGREKSRANRLVQLREMGQWQTLLVSCSNDSLLAIVEGQLHTTTAGLYRVFEYTVPTAESGAPGQLVPSNVDLMIDKLRYNHSHVGLEYARWLGANHEAVAKEMKELLEQLYVETNALREERFWSVAVAVLLQGARYSNALGFTQIDEVALKAFLVDTLEDLRSRRKKTNSDLKKTDNVASILTQFQSAMRSRHTLWTNKINQGAGRPMRGEIQVLYDRCDVSKLDGIYLQIGLNPKLMRISHYQLAKWLREAGYTPHTVFEALKHNFGAKVMTARLGSGLDRGLVSGSESLVEIDLSANPTLDMIDEA